MSRQEPTTEQKTRLDKWLWAARFFKQRNLAKEAVEGGKVLYNGQRAKPGRDVETNALIRIRRSQEELTVQVIALSDRRGSAQDAARLYKETEDSISERLRMADINRSLRMAQMPPARRPTKRDRRRIHQFNERQTSDS
jgi:ribosome-associated heat shock protein Hsp15